MHHEVEKREHWANKAEFILAVLGYSVGIGALTRFPYICYKNGGGAFLVPFAIVTIVAGAPLFYVELILAQFSAKSPLTMFPALGPAWKGLGISVTIMSGMCCLYYMPLTWSLFYLVTSLTGPVVPWADCDNDWNTEYCYDLNEVGNQSNTSNMTNSTSEFRVSPTDEFFNNYILGIAPSINEISTIRWQLVVSHFVCWSAVFFATMKGVKSAGKVVYVTATAPFLLITILLVYGLMLPGSMTGVTFFLTPDFAKLGDPEVWFEATLQMFFQLGPAWGGVLTMASYNHFNNKCYRDAVLITGLNVFTAIYSGVAIFSILGFMAEKYDQDISEVAKAGPGLAFVAYPEAIAQMPISPFFAAVFFLTLITIGIDSQFGMFDTLVSGILDSFPRLRRRKVLVTLISACSCFTLGLPFCTDIGMYLYQILDWYAACLTLAMVGLLEVVIVSYIYGLRRFCDDCKMMFHRTPRAPVRFLWLIITPVVMAILLFGGVWNLKVPAYEYGNTERPYPNWAIGFGWTIASISCIPTPIFIVVYVSYVLMKRKGSLSEKLIHCFTPTEDWVPAEPKFVSDYKKKYYNITVSDDGSESSDETESPPPIYTKEKGTVYETNGLFSLYPPVSTNSDMTEL